MRNTLNKISDKLVLLLTRPSTKRLNRKKENFFKSDAYKFARSIHQPFIESQQNAFNQTVYCGNKHCQHSTLYDASTAATGSLVSRRRSPFQNCHTLPESAQLKDICSPDNKVIWIPMPPAEHTSSRPKPYWMLGGIGQVLTFRGFCNTCDTRLFLKIDSPIQQLDNELCFLLAFRAFSYTLWRTEVVTNAKLHLLPNKLTTHIQKNNKLPPLRYQSQQDKQQTTVELQNKRNEHLSIQNRFVESIRDQSYAGLTSLVIMLKDDVPIRYSCAVPITFDFLGNQKLIRWERSVELPYVYVSLIKVGNSANLVFSIFDNVPNESTEAFINSVLKSIKRETLAQDFHNYAVLHSMGFAVNPNWFYSLPKYSLLAMGQTLTEQSYGVKTPWYRSTRGLLSILRFSAKGRFGRWEIERYEPLNTFSTPNKTRLRNVIAIAMEDHSLDFHTTELHEEWLPRIFHQKQTLFKHCYSTQNFTMVLFYCAEMLKLAQRLKTSKNYRAYSNIAWYHLLAVSKVAGDNQSINNCQAQIIP